MIIYILMLIGMTLLGAFGSLFLKKASTTTNVFKTLTNINLYLGGGMYFVSALINIYILKYLDYSVVLPLTSLTYVWTLILSFVFLHEHITLRKAFGVGLLIVGAVVVSL